MRATSAYGLDTQDQEELRNPVAVGGDLMKVFEHQQIPGIDNGYYAGESVHVLQGRDFCGL